MLDNIIRVSYTAIMMIEAINEGSLNMRTITAALCVPFMKVTGFRFSKEYRKATDGWRLFVYTYVDTVQANIWAGLTI